MPARASFWVFFVTYPSLTPAAGDISWFDNAQLNVCYNCVDRHLETRREKLALIWEGNNIVDDRRTLTYGQLHAAVCQLGNVLRNAGVRKGDTVAIYLPMVMEAAIAMLACARIGAPHTVIFAGFSSGAIRDRLEDSHACIVITADEGLRGPKVIPLKAMVDDAVRG
jgi:acetyl-CoA synthetase